MAVEIPEPSQLNMFEKIFSFIKHNTGIKTQEDLALVLSLTQPSISDAKRRNMFPLNWLVKIAVIYGLTLDSMLGLEDPHKTASIEENRKTEELMKTLEESFILLKEFDHLKSQNLAYAKEFKAMSAKLLDFERIIVGFESRIASQE